MKYILYAILFYLAYLLLKSVLSKLLNIYKYKNSSGNNRNNSTSANVHEMYNKKKKDFNSIEDAEFEEIK